MLWCQMTESKLSHNDTNLQQKLENKFTKKHYKLQRFWVPLHPQSGGLQLIEELKLYHGSQQVFWSSSRHFSDPGTSSAKTDDNILT